MNTVFTDTRMYNLISNITTKIQVYKKSTNLPEINGKLCINRDKHLKLKSLILLVIPKNALCALNCITITDYHCWLTVGPECIILPVVIASGLTWFIRYIYYWNLPFLNNV